jgi:hypothetical protein
LTGLIGYVTFSSGSILLMKSHLLRDFRWDSLRKGLQGAALRATRHADDLNRRDSMNFFALADRTTGIIE